MFGSGIRLGVLGGGQLGKMLINEAMRWDLYVRVLDPAADAPCATYADEFQRGDLMDEETVYRFGKGCDMLTIEIEHVNVQALWRLQREGVPVRPHPRVLEIIQDKSAQKQFYATHGIPTAPFRYFDDPSAMNYTEIEFPVVWKSARGGYDGKGVKVLRGREDIHKLPPGPCVLEDFVADMKEVAVIVARSVKGEMKAYPPVEMVFHPEANLVEWIAAPARISAESANHAETVALQLAGIMEIEGLLAVEMFVLPDGRIWVNESAPRTHNSGHLSIEGNYTSQFQQHLRAILGLPLGSTAARCASVMLNLVGEAGFQGRPVYQGIEQALAMQGVNVHLYGKKETRPFRKMGHVTVIADSLGEAERTAAEVRDILKIIA